MPETSQTERTKPEPDILKIREGESGYHKALRHIYLGVACGDTIRVMTRTETEALGLRG